jgi:hypothetical protein
LAYVRLFASTLIGFIVAAAALVAGAPHAAAQEDEPEGTVTIAILPYGTELSALERIPGMATGLMSAGLGRVPSAQTYLDITQGNRTSEALYDFELPFLLLDRSGVRPARWAKVVERARGAPADLVPGLMATTLDDAGVPARAGRRLSQSSIIAADREGLIARTPLGGCSAGCKGLVVRDMARPELRRLVQERDPGDAVIAIESPPPEFRVLSAAVAGLGDGEVITSGSTRTTGLVTATDITPTVLEHFGVPVPDEMNGEPITTEDADPADLESLERRFSVTQARRGPVIGQTLLIWLACAVGVAAVFRGRAARFAAALFAVSVMYLTSMLLLTAALDPSLAVERLCVLVGTPVVAAVTLRLPGWRPLAVACLVTVGTFALDMVAGSVLTPLSLPGPNPAAGSRFFGIGNEIEATVAALLPLGAGAALACFESTRAGGTRAAAAFLGAGLAGAVVFAAGRFGADVGAAIVLPTGAAVAAALALGGSRRAALVVVAAPIAGLLGLALVDLVAGGSAHLTRSVLEAGGLDEAGQVLERRIRLAGQSFEKSTNVPYLVATAIVVAVAIHQRRRILAWFADRAALAGLGGAIAATIIGTVSNDSGAVLLVLGTGYMAAAAAFAWARRPSRFDRPGHGQGQKEGPG